MQKTKNLPADPDVVNAAAALFVKSLLIGIDSAASGNRFADGEVVDIAELPFEEAVLYLKKKEVLPAAEYYKLSDKARFRAFTVSRLADGDMVERVKGLLAQNLEDGSGLKGFLEKTDTEIMNGLGLGGNGGGWYWENVYRTNVQTAYNTGRALGFEAVKPVALELVGIGDMRQTDICRSLTQPPVRRLYSDPFWKTHWPPFHFGCRTTVRAIYDPGELEEKPVTAELPEEKPARGFGTYPVTNGNWWRELSSMSKRAKKYGIQKEIETAKKLLVDKVAKEVLSLENAKTTAETVQFINSESIEIPPAKLTEYALNPNHIDGKHKAKVFETTLGYTLDNYQDLIDNVYRNINKFPFSQIGSNDQGKLFRCDIAMRGPNGKTAVVRTGWITENDSGLYRLTTIFVL